jgi:hypothetical protein
VVSGFEKRKEGRKKEPHTSNRRKKMVKVPAEIVLLPPKGSINSKPTIYQVEYFLPKRGRHFFFPKDFPLIPAEFHGKKWKKYGFKLLLLLFLQMLYPR